MVHVELDFAVVYHIVLLGHEIGHKFEILRGPGACLVAGDLDLSVRQHLDLNVEAPGG